MSSEISVDEVTIDTDWDTYNTGLLTDKLYRHVNRGDFEFELKAEQGSLLVGFTLGVGASITGAVLYDLATYLAKRLQNADGKIEPAKVEVRLEGADIYQIEIADESDAERLLAAVDQRAEGHSQEPGRDLNDLFGSSEDDEEDEDEDFGFSRSGEDDDDDDDDEGVAAAGEF